MMERKSGSSSRSPSLSRRASLKEKKISRSKRKSSAGGTSGPKRERWLLTRKTWRYMTDAVGNLLPEQYHRSSRRDSANAILSESKSEPLKTEQVDEAENLSSAKDQKSPRKYVEPSPGPSSSQTAAYHQHRILGRTSSLEYQQVFPPGALQHGKKSGSRPVSGDQQAFFSESSLKTLSTNAAERERFFKSLERGEQSDKSHEDGSASDTSVRGKNVTANQQKKKKNYAAPEDTIPAIEQHFQNVCSKEKQFLLWYRNKAKGLSGPALQEFKALKRLEEEEDKKSRQSPSGRSVYSSTLGCSCSFPHESRGRHYQIPLRCVHATCRDSHHESESGFSPSSAGNVPVSYEPWGDEGDALDDDEYDEYGDEEQVTIRERRKSSTMSIIGGLAQALHASTPGTLSLVRPMPSSGHVAADTSYAMILSDKGAVKKIYRNIAIQTDPFPEELIMKLKEDHDQREALRQQQLLSQPGFREDDKILGNEQMQMQHAYSGHSLEGKIVGDGFSAEQGTVPSGMEPGISTKGTKVEKQETERKEEYGYSTEVPSSSGQDQTDKKSEESGYSSSISDTVMRYLKMVRRNSKADAKEDKFKTVNYDRSLRYIKSKNVSVEEALEHEKNKAIGAQMPKLEENVGTNAPSATNPAAPKGKRGEPGSSVQQNKASKAKVVPQGTQAQAVQNQESLAEACHPKQEKEQTKESTPASLPSVGLQAGESLVMFLKNLSPTRKFSDFSSTSYFSSESPAETTSPRYSIATTVISSVSDTDWMQQQQALASMMAASGGPSVPWGVSTPTQRGSVDMISMDDPSECEDVFNVSTHQHQLLQNAPHHPFTRSVSTISGTSASSSSGPTTAIYKSSSAQQIAGAQSNTGTPSATSGQAFSPSLGLQSPSDEVLVTSHTPLPTYSSSPPYKKGSGIPITTQSSSGISSPTASSTGSTASLVKTFFSSTPFCKSSNLKKPASTSAITVSSDIASNTTSSFGGLSSYKNVGRGIILAPPTTTSSSPNLLSLSQNSSSSSRNSSIFMRAMNVSSPLSVSATSGAPASSSYEVLKSRSSGSAGHGYERGSHVSFKGSFPLSYSSKHTSLPSKSGRGPEIRTLATSSSGSGIRVGGSSDGGSAVDGVGGAGRTAPQGLLSSLSSSTRSVMQKSKSSSSVLPQYGTGALQEGSGRHQPTGAKISTQTFSAQDVSGAPSASSSLQIGSAGQLNQPAVVAPSATTGSGASKLISKSSKLFKSRSKSSTRAASSSTSSVTTIPFWAPQGRCKWKSSNGKQLTLEGTSIFSLTDTEKTGLQDVALEKLRNLNLGTEVKIPKDRPAGTQVKPKRRPYLLKKKALSTGFFESPSKREEPKDSGAHIGVFGIPLSQCITNDKMRKMKMAVAGAGTDGSSSFEAGQKEQIPELVKACVKHLEKYGLHTTGIFRVSTSLKRIRQLREDIDGGKELEFNEEHSPHDIAALLKEFLRDLPEPLLSRELYQPFLRTLSNGARIYWIRNRKTQLEAYQHLIQLLPQPNRDTLALLLKFFSKVVANANEQRSKTGETLPGNKMEGYSLATLIAPNILPCMPTEGLGTSLTIDQNPALAKERRESIDVVNYMISNYEQLFEVSAELLHDVYLHIMDTQPEVMDSILKQKCPPSDDGIEDFETTSSVFEGSECGEAVNVSELIEGPSGSLRTSRRNEEIICDLVAAPHFEFCKRGRDRMSGKRDSEPTVSSTRDSESDKHHSGCDSDSSTHNANIRSKWFRRGRDKTRTSSDSGSEKGAKGKKEIIGSSSVSRLTEPKRASSLDSVNLRNEVSHEEEKIGIPESHHRSNSDQSLKVPLDSCTIRRQSSPVLDSWGVITASLRIPVPVPLAIDDSNIPFIEEDNNAVPLPYIQQAGSSSVERALARGRSASTDSSIARNTSSSQATTPISSPPLHPSSEVSSPLGTSPPSSPPYDPTFPYKEMKGRILLGSSIQSPEMMYKGTASSTPLQSIGPVVSTSLQSSVPVVSTTLQSSGPMVSTSRKDSTSSVTGSQEAQSVNSKGLGKETKGANIGGIIKSKTADFEKLAGSKMKSGTIAPKMRLRSQDNIALKQHFLLRQQGAEKKTPTKSDDPNESVSPGLLKKTPQQRGLTRHRAEPPSTSGRHESTERTGATRALSKSASAPHHPGGLSGTVPASRWKRSEIIASTTPETPSKSKRQDPESSA